MSNEKRYYVISVLTRDRIAIIAEVSRALYGLGGNLMATSQTTSQGWFTMVMHADFPGGVTEEAIGEALLREGDYQVIVCPGDEQLPEPREKGEPFVVTVVGQDRPGIVHALAECFAKRSINVEDVWNEVRDGRFIVIFHVTMPRHADPKEARYELEQVGESLGVSVMLQHQDIFTATNSLSVHARLGSDKGRYL